MIQRKDLLDLDFYETAAFTGSCGSMYYRIIKVEEEGQKLLDASSWLGPYAYPRTDPDQITHHRSPFSDRGLEEIADWLSEQRSSYPDQMPGILDVAPYQNPQ